ncbi:hypothetical protein SAMN05421720_104171 [Rhodospira trueperi]|uniref:Uncharacterized protein n=1 Tax=Rhodospira trueperi TaxID=69960 RepID=A0A1G7B0Z4_9PROT|nr:hypothetical protein SAMN05421720_104171 [Rhodospira trueperi]
MEVAVQANRTAEAGVVHRSLVSRCHAMSYLWQREETRGVPDGRVRYGPRPSAIH